jgi:hypothetical protein
MNNTTSPQVTWPQVPTVSLPPAANPLQAVDILLDVDEIPATLPQDKNELAASKRYQLVVLGRGEGKGRESVLIRLPHALLDRLGELANGSRSTLIELALHHMVTQLSEARERGEPMLMVEAKELQEKLEKDLEDSKVDPEVANESDESGFVQRKGAEHWMGKAKKMGGVRAPHLRRRLPLSHLHNPQAGDAEWSAP